MVEPQSVANLEAVEGQRHLLLRGLRVLRPLNARRFQRELEALKRFEPDAMLGDALGVEGLARDRGYLIGARYEEATRSSLMPSQLEALEVA